MNKGLIAKIALDVAKTVAAPYISDECLARFTFEFLSRIDAELEAQETDVCGDCAGSGWLENREEGRYPCTCMTEAEPYQLLEQQLAAQSAALAKAREALEHLALYRAYNGDDWVERRAKEALAAIDALSQQL